MFIFQKSKENLYKKNFLFYVVFKGAKPSIYLKWPEVLDQIRGFKNPIFRCYYSLEVALGDSKYSLKVEKLFISPLILAKQEYCEIIKHFDSKDGVFSSFHEKDKKEKDIIFSSKL